MPGVVEADQECAGPAVHRHLGLELWSSGRGRRAFGVAVGAAEVVVDPDRGLPGRPAVVRRLQKDVRVVGRVVVILDTVHIGDVDPAGVWIGRAEGVVHGDRGGWADSLGGGATNRPAAGRVAADPRWERYVRLETQGRATAEDLPGRDNAEGRVGRGGAGVEVVPDHRDLTRLAATAALADGDSGVVFRWAPKLPPLLSTNAVPNVAPRSVEDTSSTVSSFQFVAPDGAGVWPIQATYTLPEWGLMFGAVLSTARTGNWTALAPDWFWAERFQL